jgi:hypothetical protein
MVTIPDGTSTRQLRLEGMRARYPDVECPRCSYRVQNLIRHFKQSHPSHLEEVYALCSANDDPQVLALNHRVLQERAEVHRTCKWDPIMCVVYFVQAGLAGRPIKIGYAQEMCRRVVHLQLGCPEPLEVLLAVGGGRELEQELHQRFAHLRIHQEWFRVDLDLMTCIHEMSQNNPTVPIRKKGAMNVWPRWRKPKLTYEECREVAQRLGVTTADHWIILHRAGELPHGATWNLPRTYPNEWRGWSEFLHGKSVLRPPGLMGLDRMLKLHR